MVKRKNVKTKIDQKNGRKKKQELKLEGVHNALHLLKKMEDVQIWNAMFANIDFVGHVDFQKGVYFIKCKLIPERQELYVYL